MASNSVTFLLTVVHTARLTDTCSWPLRNDDYHISVRLFGEEFFYITVGVLVAYVALVSLAFD